MIKTITICDCCKKEKNDLIHYIVPFPEEIVAYGGLNRSQKLIISEEMSRKEIDLCPECAKKLYLMYSLVMNDNEDKK